ncbi:ChbG/HpnK family deacetylase [Pseudoruegeria sp. HB172150]|uniref:ChbG/HpnK family deacetylase n=1 Tax=Pseudoruegeria sp. HB172150 TaxID=2721164 RepID=UPI001556A30E|nr:ChbG/HpnK family deacetylase [Pseudoruegeria sp. HB172150]
MPATRIAFHLDDVGVSYGSVVAWKDLRKSGVVRSASVMVPCPWYPMARDDWQENPGQDLGVHLTLTSEWSTYRWRPMIGPAKGLTDDEGFFHRRPGSVAASANPAAVADEIAAQIERALADGIRPTHLDAHMGTAFLEPFIGAVLDASDHYGIPVLACRDLSALIAAVAVPGFDAGYLKEFLAEVEQRGAKIFDQFLIGFCPPDTDIEAHIEHIVRGAGSGCHFWGLHANAADGMEAYAPQMAEPRLKEYELFSSPRAQALFEKLGVDPVEFRDDA